MSRQFAHTFQADQTNQDQWQMYDRGSYESTDGILTITDGWASAEVPSSGNYVLDFCARAPKEVAQVQIWAGFRHYSRDYRYVAALRGGNNNHLYLARLGAEGYDKMLALRPLEWSPQPGVWYSMRIVCAGKTIAVYVNDFENPLICVQDEDAPFENGGISMGGSYLSTQFKDICVKSVDEHFLDGVKRTPDYLSTTTYTAEEKEQERERQRATYRPYVVPAVFEDRKELSLNGNWLFIPDYEVNGEPLKEDYDDHKAHVMTVPAAWIPLQAWLEGESMRDMNKGMNDNYLVEERIRCLNQTFDYQKTKSAWYRHYLDLPKGIRQKQVVLDFEGIALISAIYFNGVRVRENIGMFTPMQIDVSDYVREGRNVIAVEVHRRLDEESEHAVGKDSIEDNYVRAWDILDAKEEEKKEASDWEHRAFNTNDIPHGFYANNPGGIWRNVRLIISDKAHVEECFFNPTLKDASIEVKYTNSDDKDRELTLSYSLVHKTTGEYLCGGIVEKKILSAGEQRVVSFVTPKVTPRLWGPGTPNLYKLTFTLIENENTIDTYQENVGFRTVTFYKQTLIYNGSPLWVRGGNHMPAHVKPNDRLLADKFMELALAHNCIATRTHVAPWTSVWLEAADEAGLMVSLEGTWPWLMLEHIPSRESVAIWKSELEQMIRRYRNHPSLFLMTMNNEMKFYLHEAPDEVVVEKGHILEGGVRMVREQLPHLPLVCDSAYYRNHTIRSGRYERIILKNGYDDGDMDDPHSYFGWYNEDFFHFMNGEYGRDYTVEGRPCMSQECSTGYPRAEDGLPTRSYLFQHQTPQTTVGKKAYEHCDPTYFQNRQSMLTKELVEVFRRVEHDRTCGVILFAFETWFYNQHDYRRIQPMLSARRLRLAYQPVLASAELWGRHFFAGDVLYTNITVVNDSNRHKELCSPRVKVEVITNDMILADTEILFDTLPYFATASKELSLQMPDKLPRGRVEARLVLKVLEEDTVISRNEYDILIGDRQWGIGTGCQDICYYREQDQTVRSLLAYYGLPSQACNSIVQLPDGAERVVIDGAVSQEEAKALYAFAEAGGKVILLGQKELSPDLLKDTEIVYTEHRHEIVTMNIPESSIFCGLEPLDLSWFSDERRVPYVAYGRYSVDRFDEKIYVLAETLGWHGYINKPTDYKQFGGTPLFCVNVGKGQILVSALRTDAVTFDPVASRITGNIIGWNFDQQ